MALFPPSHRVKCIKKGKSSWLQQGTFYLACKANGGYWIHRPGMDPEDKFYDWSHFVEEQEIMKFEVGKQYINSAKTIFTCLFVTPGKWGVFEFTNFRGIRNECIHNPDHCTDWKEYTPPKKYYANVYRRHDRTIMVGTTYETITEADHGVAVCAYPFIKRLEFEV